MQLFENVSAPATAPACFAAASVFSHDSEVCRQCGAFSECAPASVKTLEAIQSTINVSDLLRRHEVARKQASIARTTPAKTLSVAAQMAAQEDDELVAARPATRPTIPATVERRTRVEKVEFAIGASDAEIIASLPKKAAEHAMRFIRHGLIDAMRRELPAGVNPFATRAPEFMRVVCDALMSGGTTRSALKLRLMNALEWGDTTASSHVSQIWPLLTRFQIAVENDGVLTLIPASA
ncbi:hypothetical protein [Paraburkholderia sp.]|uniref:hypothetical protein n=1 Tax=Paraburkholderia sp. TaxID=1926495 RepID=UPI0039E27DE8